MNQQEPNPPMNTALKTSAAAKNGAGQKKSGGPSFDVNQQGPNVVTDGTPNHFAAANGAVQEKSGRPGPDMKQQGPNATPNTSAAVNGANQEQSGGPSPDMKQQGPNAAMNGTASGKNPSNGNHPPRNPNAIYVEPRPSDSQFFPPVMEKEALWCCCGAIGGSITGAIASFFPAAFCILFAIKFPWEDWPYKLLFGTPGLLFASAMILNIIAACKSGSSTLLHATGTVNIVCKWIMVVIDTILSLLCVPDIYKAYQNPKKPKPEIVGLGYENKMKYAYEPLSFGKKYEDMIEYLMWLVGLNALFITFICIYSRLGDLQFEAAEKLRAKEAEGTQ